MTSTRLLCLMRHAEAVPPELAADDHGRPLTAHGRRQCRERAIQSGDDRFDLVLASSAQRTIETANLVFAGLGPVRQEPRLYNASLQALLYLIAGQSEAIGSLAVVAHNPGISDLAGYLSGNPRHLPPASLLLWHVSGNWAEFSAGNASLTTAMVD